MIEGHQRTLTLMQNEAENGRDPDLKHFADRTAPVVQMHLSAIQKIHDHMK
jgi:putative membrane protein